MRERKSRLESNKFSNNRACALIQRTRSDRLSSGTPDPRSPSVGSTFEGGARMPWARSEKWLEIFGILDDWWQEDVTSILELIEDSRPEGFSPGFGNWTIKLVRWCSSRDDHWTRLPSGCSPSHFNACAQSDESAAHLPSLPSRHQRWLARCAACLGSNYCIGRARSTKSPAIQSRRVPRF